MAGGQEECLDPDCFRSGCVCREGGIPVCHLAQVVPAFLSLLQMKKKVDVDLGAGTEMGGRANGPIESLNSTAAYRSVYFYTTTLKEQ